MRRLQLGLMVLLLAALLSAFLIPRSARADETPWYCAWDFSASDQSFTADTTRWVGYTPVSNANYSAGTGWTAQEHVTGYYDYEEVGVWSPTYSINAQANQIRLTYNFSGAVLGGYYLDVSWGITHVAVSGLTATGTGLQYTWTGTYSIDRSYVWLSNATAPPAGTAGSPTLTKYELWGAGDNSPCGPGATATFTPTPTTAPTATLAAPPPTPSGACASSWTRTWDFRQGDGGWVIPFGTQLQGRLDDSGWHTGPFLEPDSIENYAQHLLLDRLIGRVDHESETIITAISLDVDYNPGGAGDTDVRRIELANNTTRLITAGSPPASGQRTLSLPSGTISTGGLYHFRMYASGLVGDPDLADGTGSVTSITMSGTGYDPDGMCTSSAPSTDASSWAYPVAQGEMRGNGSALPLSEDGVLTLGRPMFRSPFDYLLTDIPAGTYDHNTAGDIFYGHSSTTNVHSMTGGTVNSVTPLFSAPGCRNANPTQPLQPLPEYSCFYDAGIQVNALNYHDASLVIIQTDAALISYLVREVRVSEGQTVSKGCILGTALPFKKQDTSVGLTYPVPSVGFNWTDSQDGYTVIQARDLTNIPFNLVPYLREQPQNITCTSAGGGGGGGGCKYVKDASFSLYGDNASAWYVAAGEGTGGAPEHPQGQGMGLWLKQQTTQPLVILPDQSYGITIEAHLLQAGSNNFTVSVGSGSVHQYTVSTITQMTFTAAPETISLADNGILLSLTPEDSSQNIVVDYACVTDADSGPPAPAGGCLLLNPDFDTHDGWTLGGSAAYDADTPGVVFLPDSGTASQSLHLFPASGGAESYTITVQASAGIAPAEGQSFSVGWSWDTHSGTLGPFADNLLHSDSDTFSVAAETTDDLVLTGSLTGTSTPGYVDRVCIETSDGSSPPGYQVPAPPGISPSCKLCSYKPIGDINYDLAGVIGWLMCGISQIWNCQMRTILYGIWQAAVNILAFLGMMRLWLAYTVMSLASWTNVNVLIVTRWFNGQFINLGQMLFSGPRAVVSSDTGSNLWDTLRTLFNTIGSVVSSLTGALTTLFNDLRDVLETFFNDLLTILRIIVVLAAAIINLILSFVFQVIREVLGILRSFVDAIITALNAPPVVPSGVPVCDDSAELIAENCVAIFMIDNSILGDQSPLWQLLPLIEGAAGFGMLWWAAIKFRNLLAGLSDS